MARPLFWGRRIYVSFVWTIYGGSRSYRSHSASRSLCCLSLGLTAVLTAYLVPSPPQSLSGKIEVEVRLSLASFPLMSWLFAARLDVADRRLFRGFVGEATEICGLCGAGLSCESGLDEVKVTNPTIPFGDHGAPKAGGVGLAVRTAERKRRSAAPAAGTRKPVRRLWNCVEKTPVSQGRLAPPKEAVAKSGPSRAWLPVRASRKDTMRR